MAETAKLQVHVVCRDTLGVLDTHTMLVAVRNGQQSGAVVSPVEYARLANNGQSMKWRSTIKVFEPEKARPGMSLEDWALHNQLELPSYASLRQRGGRASESYSKQQDSQQQGQQQPSPRLRSFQDLQIPSAPTLTDLALLQSAADNASPSSACSNQTAGVQLRSIAKKRTSSGMLYDSSLLQDQRPSKQYKQAQQPPALTPEPHLVAQWPLPVEGLQEQQQQQQQQQLPQALSRASSSTDEQLLQAMHATVHELAHASSLPAGVNGFVALSTGQPLCLQQLQVWVMLLGGCQEVTRCGAWSCVAARLGLDLGCALELQQLYTTLLLAVEKAAKLAGPAAGNLNKQQKGQARGGKQRAAWQQQAGQSLVQPAGDRPLPQPESFPCTPFPGYYGAAGCHSGQQQYNIRQYEGLHGQYIHPEHYVIPMYLEAPGQGPAAASYGKAGGPEQWYQQAQAPRKRGRPQEGKRTAGAAAAWCGESQAAPVAMKQEVVERRRPPTAPALQPASVQVLPSPAALRG